LPNLHNDKEAFNDIILATSNAFGIEFAIVEKDYYVSLLLNEINQLYPDIIFKGGTSLSKCYKIINRFSEDIDIGINADKATEGMRKNLKNSIKEAIENLGFTLDNTDEIMTRTYFNKYQITYPIINNTIMSIKPYLYVETAVFMKPFPYEIEQADTYIYRFLNQNNQEKLIEKYGLEPFDIKVQSLARTFIDKLFALGDYYLTGNKDRTSRHLYDLYKLMPKINFDDEFYTLFNEVREIRQQDSACPSAKPNQNIKNLLQKIYSEDFFKSDYNNVTRELLFESVDYAIVKNNLSIIINKL
jgi:predicted nucleotidyltransferase component of viral defense system